MGVDRPHPDQMGVLGGPPVRARHRLVGDWTWVHSPSFRATPLDLKGEAHEHLLAGINQFIGHGWPYSPRAPPGLGWFFYASGALDDRNPWWPAMAPLARYLTRLCWLMRQGAPVSDVLVYVLRRGRSRPAGDGGRWVAGPVARGARGGRGRRDPGDPAGWLGLRPDRRRRPRGPSADGSRPVIISGATALSARPDWFETYRRRWHRDHGGFRRRHRGRNGLWAG